MRQRVMQVARERLQGKRNEEGVTLIELLAVIVILAVIAAIAVPVVLGSISKSKVSVTQQNMAVIVEALNRYATNNDGNYPSTGATGSTAATAKWIDISISTGFVGSDATALTTNPLTSPDPNNNSQAYLKVIPNDGWGNHFYYSSDGKNGFLIHTADGKATTTGATPTTFSVIPTGSSTTSDTWWMNTSMASPSNSLTVGNE